MVCYSLCWGEETKPAMKTRLAGYQGNVRGLLLLSNVQRIRLKTQALGGVSLWDEIDSTPSLCTKCVARSHLHEKYTEASGLPSYG